MNAKNIPQSADEWIAIVEKLLEKRKPVLANSNIRNS